MTGGRPISEFERQSETPSIKLALSLDRQALTAALDRRVEEMYSAGLIDETKRLLDSYPRSAKPFSTIGYREAAAVASGELALEQAIAETRRRTRAYAKRQMTWLRAERNVHWIDAGNREKAFAAALRLIEGES